MASKPTKTFFNRQKEGSQKKANIVSNYFWIWSKTLVRKLRPGQYLQFLDLYAGAGRYVDGNASTPLLILEKIVRDEQLRENVKLIFNEKKKANYNALLEEINSYPGIETLKYAPVIYNKEVGGGDVESMLLDKQLMPTLIFADPFGYKGLSTDLFATALRQYGCEIIFFFNYRRINAAISNKVFEPHMEMLFGQERAKRLRADVTFRTEYDAELGETITEPVLPKDRELILVSGMRSAFSDGFYPQKIYTQEFQVKTHTGGRTSHYLMFVTKNAFAFGKMTEVMAKQSSQHIQGVASLGYNPKHAQLDMFLSTPERGPLDELMDELANFYAGQSLVFEKLFREHQLIAKRFTFANYREALLRLEKSGKISVSREEERRVINDALTLPEDCVVTFAK